MHSTRRFLFPIMLVILPAACGKAEPSTQAIVANAHQSGTLSIGEQRLLVGLVDSSTNEPLGSPDLDVEIDVFFGDDPGDVERTVDGHFIWTVPGVRGLYRATVEFDRAGTWGLIVRSSEAGSSAMTLFSVVPESPVPRIGGPAISVATPTSGERPVHEISSDPAPDERFYEVSIDEALQSDKPAVIVFATPAFCTSAACGPVLDVVKDVSVAFPGIHFIHVEVYENLDAASYDELVVAKSVAAWGLPSEPWVFVVAADGTIIERFEGAVGEDELVEVLNDL